MKNVDLKLNTTLKLVGVAPLKLVGYCITTTNQEHHFTILEVRGDGGYRLTGSDGYDELFFSLKEAIQQCWLNWGDLAGCEVSLD